MDRIAKTVGEYLALKEKTITKKKYAKLAEVLNNEPKETEVKWAYFPSICQKDIDTTSTKPATIDLISTIDVDRDEEILIPQGCNLEKYQKTPTVLFGHAYNTIPVGISKWQKKTEKGILSRTEYYNSQFARDVFEAASSDPPGLANSVGFIPRKWVERGNEEYEIIKKTYGITANPIRIYTEWDLLEYSKVPVPANPEAITMTLKMVKSQEMKDWLQQELDNILQKRVCGNRDLPVSDRDVWDGNAARKRIEQWATEGEEINWKKYQQAFVYVDPDAADTKGGYKLPFADIIDGKLTAVWGGIKAAMGALLGARGGVDISDNERKAAYNFLVGYYKKLDREPPEFREYTEDELKEMFPDEGKEEISAHPENKKEDTTKPEDYTISEKIGAVLNRKNKEKLQQAQALIQEVIDSAQEDEDDNKQKQTPESNTQNDNEGTETKEEKEEEKGCVIEGLIDKEDEVSDEDGEKILRFIDKAIEQKINRILGKV